MQIILKEPVKVALMSPLYQVEIEKIIARNEEGNCRVAICGDSDRPNWYKLEPEMGWSKADVLAITPQLVMAKQHGDWLDVERSVVPLYLIVPVGNIAAILPDSSDKTPWQNAPSRKPDAPSQSTTSPNTGGNLANAENPPNIQRATPLGTGENKKPKRDSGSDSARHTPTGNL
jgi:hypothetical protein